METALAVKKYLIPVLIAAYAVLAPIHATLVVVGILIFGDMILGVWAASKTGEPIRSARLRDTVSKLLIYHMALVLGFLVEIYLFHGFMPVVKITAATIGLVEIKSVFENAGLILGKPLFKEIIKKLGSKNR